MENQGGPGHGPDHALVGSPARCRWRERSVGQHGRAGGVRAWPTGWEPYLGAVVVGDGAVGEVDGVAAYPGRGRGGGVRGVAGSRRVTARMRARSSSMPKGLVT